MRKLSDGEVLTMTNLLNMENDELVVAKAMHSLITDGELKKQSEACIMTTEGRINGLQQFINENQVKNTLEVH